MTLPKEKKYILKYLPDTGDELVRQLQNNKLEELGRNPYILRMLILVFDNDGTLPDDLDTLIASFIDVLIARERDKVAQEGITKEALIASMEHLALGMILEGLRGTVVSRNWAKQNIPSPSD